MRSNADNPAGITDRPAGGFGVDWIVLGHAGGAPPPVTAFPIVAKAARDLLMSRWKGDIPEILSGHDEDGEPSRNSHIGFAPMACVGGRDADGRLMGLALVPPRGGHDPEQRRAIRGIVDEIEKIVGQAGEAPSRLTLGSLGVWHVERRAAPHSYFLNPKRYLESSKRWATVTPIVLDRFPKEKTGLSLTEVIEKSCTDAGLPKPLPIRLTSQPKVTGAIPALIGGRAWSEDGWRLPCRPDGTVHYLSNRPIYHAVIEFTEPVSGPVLIGAGRFMGLGLCLPFNPLIGKAGAVQR
jgi:CRISPR-associated protein Csb2